MPGGSVTSAPDTSAPGGAASASAEFRRTRSDDEHDDGNRIKAFVPARDFDLSKRFYQDLGFEVAWSSDDLASLRHGTTSFLLQRFYQQEHAANFMMHLLVDDVDAWWAHVEARRLAETYRVKTEPPSDKPWRMRDFAIVDPIGVLWRIGQNIP